MNSWNIELEWSLEIQITKLSVRSNRWRLESKRTFFEQAAPSVNFGCQNAAEIVARLNYVLAMDHRYWKVIGRVTAVRNAWLGGIALSWVILSGPDEGIETLHGSSAPQQAPLKRKKTHDQLH